MIDISWDEKRGVESSWKHRKSFTKKKNGCSLCSWRSHEFLVRNLSMGSELSYYDNLGRGNTCFRIRYTRSWPCHVATAEELEAKEKS